MSSRLYGSAALTSFGSVSVTKKCTEAIMLLCLTRMLTSSTFRCSFLRTVLRRSRRCFWRSPISASLFRVSSRLRSSCSALRLEAAELAGRWGPNPPSNAPKSRWLRLFSSMRGAPVAWRVRSEWVVLPGRDSGDVAWLRSLARTESSGCDGEGLSLWRLGDAFETSDCRRLVPACGGGDGEACGRTTAEASVLRHGQT